MTITLNQGKLPAGTYYVGDLCYVVNDDDWSDFCERSFPDSYTEVVGIFETFEGINYANFGTKYGDGGYADYEGRLYLVDSGSIGCIPISAISDKYDEENIKRLGNFVSFDEPFDCEYDDETGTIRIGHIEIITGDYPEDEEDDYDHDSEDEE